MKKMMRWPSAAMLAAMLVACGGGGGGGGGGSDDGGPAQTAAPPTATPPQSAGPAARVTEFDLAGAYANYLAGSVHYTFSGRATGLGEVIDIQGFGDVSAPVASSFNGIPTLRKTTSAVVVGTDQRGASQTQRSSADRYYDSNYRHIATVTSGTGGDFEIVTMAALPAKVQPGASGEWSTSIAYSDAALTRVVNTATARYTVQRESDTTALLNVISTATADGARVEVTDRYRLQNDRTMRQVSQHVDTPTVVSNLDYR